MNLTLVHYSFGGTVGGVEFVMEAHAKLFEAHGHRVQVLCGSGPASDPRVIAIPELRANPETIDLPALAKKLRALLRHADMVFVHNILTMPFNPAATEAIWNMTPAHGAQRWIAWIHDLAACHPNHAAGAVNPLFHRAAPSFEYVAVSEQRRAEFKNLTGVEARVIPNGIDPMRLLNLTGNVETLARDHSILEQDIVLLIPARLLKRKNLELAVGVVAELKARGTKACAIITGAPDVYNLASEGYKARLCSLAKELGVAGEIIFPGLAVTRDDLASLYSIADALFFPSRQEGFGIPLLEAALHRLPVFCSEVESMKAIAPAGATFFSPDAHPALIARQIMEQTDTARSARKRVVRDFSWDTIYTRYLLPLLNSR